MSIKVFYHNFCSSNDITITQLKIIYICEKSSNVTEDSGESAGGILKIILEGRFLMFVFMGSKDSLGLCDLP